MAKKIVGITRQETREEQISRVRNELIAQLHEGGFTYTEITKIINVDRASANRIARFGKNSTPVTTA